MMGSLQFTSTAISNLAPKPTSLFLKSKTQMSSCIHPHCCKPIYSVGSRARRIGVATEKSQVEAPSQEEEEELEPPSVDFAFVSPVLLPDGTPDIHYRTACGGQKLRDIMLDQDIELYGPYKKPLLNCAGGGTCGTCMVEVVGGKEIMNARTEKEKEILKKKPKSWRLACQAIVGKEDSRGQAVIQTLPEWKAHQWNTKKT